VALDSSVVARYDPVRVGKGEVLENIRSLISSDDNRPEWVYFQSLSPSDTCDLLRETDSLVRQYRRELIRLRNDWPSGIDFSKTHWEK